MTTVSEEAPVVTPTEEVPPTPPTPTTPDTPKTPSSTNKKKSKKDKTGPSRFEGGGVSFRGKLIGIDNVPEPRGDIMCQQSMQKLKGGVKQAGTHKQKIVINVSLVGLQIIDVNSMAPNYRHPVHRISFISRDVTDQRAFGYVFGEADGTHKFFAIKTEKAAEQLVLALRDLFQCVFELKKKEMEEAQQKQDGGETAGNAENTYDVPASNAPITDGNQEGGDAIYSVPGNNGAVEGETTGGTGNLLDLQSELNTIQQGIAQMDAFGDSFFTSEAPTTQSAPDPWGTQQAAQPPAVSPTNNPFVVQIQTQKQHEFEATFLQPNSQPTPVLQQPPTMAVQNQFASPFGNTMAVPQPNAGFNAFNQQAPYQNPPTAGFNAFGSANQQAFAAPAPVAADPFKSDPFFVASNPPTAPGDKYSVFGSAQTPINTPMPNQQAAPIDPFASVPASSLLQPVQLQSPQAEEEVKPKSSDFFGDLCDIGSSRPTEKIDPFIKKDPFAEVRTPKKSLNELRNPNGTPVSSLPAVTPQSDPFSLPPAMPSNQVAAPAVAANPFGAPTTNNDPADPFAQFASAQMAAPVAVTQAPSSDPFAEFLAPKPQVAPTMTDDFNLPSPNVPPPPVPANNQLDMFDSAPAPPPRPVGGQSLLQGPPSAKPRQAMGDAPVPRPRTTVRQNGTNDPFNAFDVPGQSNVNPFDAGFGASQPEEPLYAVVNKPKKK